MFGLSSFTLLFTPLIAVGLLMRYRCAVLHFALNNYHNLCIPSVIALVTVVLVKPPKHVRLHLVPGRLRDLISYIISDIVNLKPTR